MGFFDYVGGKLQQANEQVREAEMEAESWSADRICSRLKNTSSMTKSTGYRKALQNKCREMSDRELEDLFEDVYRSRNAQAYGAVFSIMEERDLAYKDSNGKVVLQYQHNRY
jgi:hypothetical protein